MVKKKKKKIQGKSAIPLVHQKVTGKKKWVKKKASQATAKRSAKVGSTSLFVRYD